MAGEAKTSKFMLGTATVMLGPVAELYNLTPETHSIGLVKNFRIQSQPGYTDLTQGVKSTKVFSVMTSNEVTASAEVYEYTTANIMYSLGLEGRQAAAPAVTTVATAGTAASTTVALTSATGIVAGDYIAIEMGGENVVIRKVVSLATNTATVTPAISQAVPKDAVVRKVTAVSIGSKDDQPFLAMKVVGKLADGTTVTILCPKIRITNGFSLGFTSDNFDNLPYEMAFYDLVATDPHYADFKNEQAKIFAA